MCIDYPGRVLAVEAGSAIVETRGRRRAATTLLVPGVAVGDWVIVAAGTIVDRLTDDEARTIQALLTATEDETGPEHGSPRGREPSHARHQ